MSQTGSEQRLSPRGSVRQAEEPGDQPPGREPGVDGGIGAVLARPDFRRLWLGQIFSQLADKF